MVGPGVEMPSADESENELRAAIERRLTATRDKTLALVADLPDEIFYGQPANVMGVPAWDIGHIGFFEHRWLVDALGGDPVDAEQASLYDPFEHPRSERGELDLPERKGLRSYLSDVRERALEVLGRVELAGDGRLTRDGFVHDMIVRHEDQHRENVLVTLNLYGETPTLESAPDGPVDIEGAYRPSQPEATPDPGADVDGMVEVPACTFELGVDPQVGTYDNEWSAHEVEVDAFEIDRAPVTNAEYRVFMQDGGYDEDEHWSEDGWMIRQALDVETPMGWTKIDGEWFVRRAGRLEPLPEDEPVMHVSYYEAQAYANWANKRLPTEAEFEAAASLDPDTGEKRRFPWGPEAWQPRRGNLGQRTHRPAPVGTYPEGASPLGVHQLVGDIWEWTSSTFDPYPGFEAYPYPEYSEEHFGKNYRVLRGGSWATEPSYAHSTFRNWHQPDHQQLFAGFRCARDAS